jgi:hypothetical protein
MASKSAMTTSFRLFIASPGDVTAERDKLCDVVGELNRTHGKTNGYVVEPLRWETHAAPSGGRPQAVITEQLGEYDIFVGIMWRRFGTPTGVAGSGTEEEYRQAYRKWENNPSMPLMFYFSQCPFMPRQLDEIDQVRQVLLFRQEIERKALVWDYQGADGFEQNIRKHLMIRMKRLVEDHKRPRGPKAVPDERSIEDLRALWDHMVPELQRAFNIAYNENRRAGDPGIQTRDLFAAMLRAAEQQLAPIVTELPRKALPEPVAGQVNNEPYLIQERPWLSHCVASSISRLRRKLPEGRSLTATDIFADIAKNGSGESVALLRQYDIGPAEIDAILKKKNLTVLTT